jgi:hypothetical protein
MSLILRGLYQRRPGLSRRRRTTTQLRQHRAVDNSVTGAIASEAEEPTVVDLMVAIADGRRSEQKIATWLRRQLP